MSGCSAEAPSASTFKPSEEGLSSSNVEYFHVDSSYSPHQLSEVGAGMILIL